MEVFHHRNSYFKQKLFQPLNYTLKMFGQIFSDFYVWANSRLLKCKRKQWLQSSTKWRLNIHDVTYGKIDLKAVLSFMAK